MSGMLQRFIQRLAPVSDGTGPAAAREALGLCLGLIIVLGISKPLLDGALGLTGAAFTLAAAWQVFIPLDRLDARGVDPATFGIHAHGLLGNLFRRVRILLWVPMHAGTLKVVPRTFSAWFGPYVSRTPVDWRGARRDVGFLTLASVLTFPPFVVGYVLWQQFLAERAGHTAVFTPTLPPSFVEMVFTQICVVGVCEELFYRGYIHTLLIQAWPPRFTFWGASLGKAVMVGSALFALGHFVGEWNPLRLGPFFPALLFCALRSAGGSIMGAVVYHGLCNIVGEVMRVSVTWQ